MARTINYRSTVAVPGSERITFLLTLLLGSGKSRKWSREAKKEGWMVYGFRRKFERCDN